MITIDISGIDEAVAALGKRAAEAEKKLEKGIAVGGAIVTGEARANCPVSTAKTRPGGPHGELRRSILPKASGLNCVIGTNKEYAGYVEFGTHKMAAQPYLVPALKSKESDVIAAIKAQFAG